MDKLLLTCKLTEYTSLFTQSDVFSNITPKFSFSSKLFTRLEEINNIAYRLSSFFQLFELKNDIQSTFKLFIRIQNNFIQKRKIRLHLLLKLSLSFVDITSVIADAIALLAWIIIISGSFCKVPFRRRISLIKHNCESQSDFFWLLSLLLALAKKFIVLRLVRQKLMENEEVVKKNEKLRMDIFINILDVITAYSSVQFKHNYQLVYLLSGFSMLSSVLAFNQ